MADSLVELLHSDITNTTEIYFAARTVTANLGYYYTNSKSFEQLKTGGLLRYIKNKELLDSIGNLLCIPSMADQSDRPTSFENG